MSVYGVESYYLNEMTDEINFSKRDYEKLKNYIQDSFELGEEGQPEYITTVQGKVDLYRSTFYYTILQTCNSWVSSTLSSTSIFNFSSITAEGVEEEIISSRFSEGREKNSCITHRKKRIGRKKRS